MSLATHFLVGWVVANSDHLNRRERAAVTIASVVPDVDSLGIIAGFLTGEPDQPLMWYSQYHHVVAHNVGFGLLVAGVSFMVVTRRWTTASLALLSFHLHLLGDLLGSRGPDGYQWPIPYLFPFSNAWEWSWQGQWELNAWPNFLITAAALGVTLFLAWKQGYSPLEMISPFADKVFIEALRHRFPHPRPGGD